MGELNSDYEKLIEGFDRDSSGTNRTKTLCENLKPLHFLIFQRYSESVVAEASKDMNDKIKAKNLSEENQRVLNDKLKNLDNRIERTNDGTDNELERLHRENSNMRDQLEEANNQVLEKK